MLVSTFKIFLKSTDLFFSQVDQIVSLPELFLSARASDTAEHLRMAFKDADQTRK